MTVKKAVKKVAKKTVKKAVKKVAKKTVKKVKPIAPKQDPGVFYVTLKVNGEEVKACGTDMVDILTQIKPIFIKTNCVIKVEKDGKAAEKFMLTPRANLLFRNKVTMMVFANTLLLK